MIKLILTVVSVVLFLLVAGCSDNYSASIWGDEELGARLGNYLDAEKKTEAGVSGTWRDEDMEPVTIGIYAIRHEPNMVEIPNPIVWEGLRDTIIGSPYFGLALDRNLIIDSTDISQIAGISIENFLFIEHRFNSDMPNSTILGIKYDF